MAKTTARSRTPIKNPLSSCRSPTTSSNSPVSLLRMFYDRGAPGPLPLPYRSRTPLNDASISSGRGKTIIVFFSVPISTKVWRYRNWMAAGCFWITSAAMASFSDAEYSPSAWMILARHSANHRLRQIHLLDFHHGHFHTPRRCVLVENGLQPDVQLFALAQQFVQLHFAQHAAQRGLRQLRGGIEEIRNLHHRQARFHHAEINHRIHLDGHVIARDHVLRGHLQGIDAQRHPHHPVDGREHQDDARTLGLRQQAAETENDAAFVFPQNLDGTDQVQYDDHHNDGGETRDIDVHFSLLFDPGPALP